MPRITIRSARAADRIVRQVVRDLPSRRMLKALWGLCLATALLPAQAEEVYYIHTDALGSPVAETDANRNVVHRYEYEPYGRRLNGSNDDKPGYTGHVMDAATGLVQMQQRYYDPGIGRFLSVDPVTAYDNGDLRHFNRYAYAYNNPYKFTDPDGRAAICLVPGPMQACMAAGAAAVKGAIWVGGAIGAAWAGSKLYNEIANEAAETPQPPASPDSTPEAPGELVGEQDGQAGTQGGRHNSGPLSSENGGTGNAAGDFEKLTGGKSGPAPEGSKYPAGTQVGENGVAIRPGTEKTGPRIDIPARGDKPHETLHYPKER